MRYQERGADGLPHRISLEPATVGANRKGGYMVSATTTKRALKGMGVPMESNLGFFRRLYNVFWMLFVWRVPARIGQWLFEHTSNHSASLKRYAKTYYALELIYETRPLDHGRMRERFWTWFWEHSLWNARAVRNRLAIVRALVKSYAARYVRAQGSANIVSVASGSARAVIEALDELGDRRVRALMTDMSRNALDYSRALADSMGVSEQMAWQRVLAHKFHTKLDGFSPDLVEMVGLLDYFTVEDAQALLRNIYAALPNGGVLITANVLPNPEMRWPEVMADWGMVYKTVPEFQAMAYGAGFEQVEVLVEPIGIHAIMVCHKHGTRPDSATESRHELKAL